MPDRAYGVRHACGFYGSVGRGLGTRGGHLAASAVIALPLADSGLLAACVLGGPLVREDDWKHELPSS